jgi:hypothetical protein
MRAVILAPYTRNEDTAAAVRLADLAMSLGLDVRLVSTRPRERDVNPYWDDRVVSFDVHDVLDGRLAGVARRASVFVHFGHDPVLLEHARLVAPDARQVLVFRWHSCRGRPLTAADYDFVVCPSEGAMRGAAEVLHAVPARKLTWCHWDHGARPVSRDGTVSDAKVRACFLCDCATIDFCAATMLEVVGQLLAAHPRLDVSVAHTKAWTRDDRRTLASLRHAWPGRLRAAKLTDVRAQMVELHHNDWAVVPSVRAEFGSFASLALACGVPVVCHNVCPFNEIVRDRRSGLLVPCDTARGASGAPVAVPSLARWLATCAQAFSGAQPLFNLQVKDWHLAERRRGFEEKWAWLFGLPGGAADA